MADGRQASDGQMGVRRADGRPTGRRAGRQDKEAGRQVKRQTGAWAGSNVGRKVGGRAAEEVVLSRCASADHVGVRAEEREEAEWRLLGSTHILIRESICNIGHQVLWGVGGGGGVRGKGKDRKTGGVQMQPHGLLAPVPDADMHMRVNSQL